MGIFVGPKAMEARRKIARKPLKIGDCGCETPLKLFGENFSREPEVGRNTLNVIMIF